MHTDIHHCWQIVAGLANGQIVVLYSPEMSHNGAKLVMSKGPPRKITIEDMSDALSAPAILTPHALPMFRDMDPGRGSKRKREKERMDPRKSRRPDLPVTGPGKGGRVGASATQHVVQNLVRDTTRDVDVSLYPTGKARPRCLCLVTAPWSDGRTLCVFSHTERSVGELTIRFRSLAKRCSSMRKPQRTTPSGLLVSGLGFFLRHLWLWCSAGVSRGLPDSACVFTWRWR
jgi:hypothetical protein